MAGGERKGGRLEPGEEQDSRNTHSEALDAIHGKRMREVSGRVFLEEGAPLKSIQYCDWPNCTSCRTLVAWPHNAFPVTLLWPSIGLLVEG